MLGKLFLDTARPYLPKVSITEQQALEGGTTGWEGSIFNGKPDWDKIIGGYPAPRLTAEEQSFLDNETEELCEAVNAWQVKDGKDLPDEVWQMMADKKFFGMLIPKKYGGLGFSALARSAVVQKLSTRDITTAVTVMVPNSLGPGELLERYGTQAQKDYYLPRLAVGQEIPCFALTEINAGSDATSVQANGVVEKDPETGKPVIRLNYDKRYITLAPKATLLGLAFQLHDPENLLGKGEKPGITVALVPTNRDGMDMSRRHMPMHIPFMNGSPRGTDVMITADDIIGGVDGVGKGWPMLVECLSEGRANSLPSQGTAAAKYAARVSGAYTRIRQQFGTPIHKFEGIEEKLAEIVGYSYINDAAQKATLLMVDNGEKPAVPSAIIKYHATEYMRTAINNAMDIHGGKAIMQGPSNYMSDIYDAIPVAITVEGANIMTRNMLIFGQGSYRLHPHLRKIKDAIDNNDAGTAIGEIFKAYVASPTMGIVRGLVGGGNVPSYISSEIQPYVRRINRLSRSFNAVANPTATFLGGELKRKERISARLGDAFSHLFMAACVVNHYQKRGSLAGELPVAEWALKHSLFEAQKALEDVTSRDNSPFPRWHPARWMRGVQSVIVRMNGNKKPSFKLDAKVANSVVVDSDLRERLTDNVFIPKNPNEPIAKLERAFKLVCETENLTRTLRDFTNKDKSTKNLPFEKLVDLAANQNVISREDAQSLLEMHTARQDVFRVDTFDRKTFHLK